MIAVVMENKDGLRVYGLAGCVSVHRKRLLRLLRRQIWEKMKSVTSRPTCGWMRLTQSCFDRYSKKADRLGGQRLRGQHVDMHEAPLGLTS